MAQELAKSTVYIDLDALLDTRMATIASFGLDKAVNVINKSYHTRELDIFPDIDPDEFNERYKNRTKEILKDALITPMGSLINEFCVNTIKNIHSSPFHYQPKVTLNIYPYVLTESEEAVILNAVAAMVHGIADIEIVNFNVEELTPIYIRSDVSIMIKYDYLTWLEAHTVNGNFKKTTLPAIKILCPAIYTRVLKPFEKVDLFENMEKISAPIISLKYMPIKMFSFTKLKGM